MAIARNAVVATLSTVFSSETFIASLLIKSLISLIKVAIAESKPSTALPISARLSRLRPSISNTADAIANTIRATVSTVLLFRKSKIF